MDEGASSTYRQCQSLVKGLEILTSLNRYPSGSASITELVHHTGIHRTTVKRLLETLRNQSYVSHDAATNHYRLTFRVQRLSYGFRDTVLLVEQAWPAMYALSKSIVWPCSLLVPEGDEMVVRASTRLYSRLSFHPGMPGRRLPMLTTAAGRAYIANVGNEERETLLELLRGRQDAEGNRPSSTASVASILNQIRLRGYALNLGEWADEPKFGGIAMPIRQGDEVLACLNVIFLTRAVKEIDMLPKLVASLKETVARIEEQIGTTRESGIK